MRAGELQRQIDQLAASIQKADSDIGALAAKIASLDAALKKVLQVIYKDHPLSPNQILVLSSELQRLGVHQLVEEQQNYDFCQKLTREVDLLSKL